MRLTSHFKQRGLKAALVMPSGRKVVSEEVKVLVHFDEILRSQSFYLLNNIHWKIVTIRPGTCITKVNGLNFDHTLSSIFPNKHLLYESQADVHYR